MLSMELNILIIKKSNKKQRHCYDLHASSIAKFRMSLFVYFFSEITCAVYLISLHHDDRVINMSLAVMGIVNQPLWDWFVTFALNCFSAALPLHYKQAISTFTTSTHIALTMLST